VANASYVTKLGLDKPVIQLSAMAFDKTVKSINVTLSHPNPLALSKLINWFDGQDEATQAITYTGPFTLNVTEWETYLSQAKARPSSWSAPLEPKAFSKRAAPLMPNS
jgi:hypothetical protein